MKKTISLVLVLAFMFSLAINLPVLAEDNTGVATETPMLISTNVEATSTVATSTTTTNLEKIPSQEYMKYFREIRKIGDALFGIRKPAAEIEKLKQENKATSTTAAIHQESRATSTATTTLEKIPSPAHIDLFKEIKKIGDALFGVRKASSTIEVKATTTPNKLERIASLEQTKLFEKITKIGKDLFGIRKGGALKTLPTMTTELITCSSAAIDTKDTAISAALSAASSDIAAAITARGTCQKAALAAGSEVQGSLNKCNKAFQEAAKVANDKAKTAQQDIWTTYKASLKTCSTTASTTEIVIEDGGEVLK